MPQNPLDVLNDPLAQELLGSNIPARLAYTGLDGFPRVIPIGFHWNGSEIVMATSPISPKTKALARDPHVAITIDSAVQPPHVLLIRGTAALDVVDGVPDDFLHASRKVLGDDAMPAFEQNARAMYAQMTRIVVTPTWAKLLDFETRLPTFIERLIKERSLG